MTNMAEHAVQYVLRLHDPSNRDINECMQYGVYLLKDGISRSEKLGQSDQVCILYDLSGFSYKNLDYQLFTSCTNLVTMLEYNYGERLGALYVIGAGSFYSKIFNLTKRFFFFNRTDYRKNIFNRQFR